MHKIICTAAAVALLSLGSYVSAQAGGATSAPCKYSRNAPAANVSQPQTSNVQTATADVAITEFSSSSARSSVPKR